MLSSLGFVLNAINLALFLHDFIFLLFYEVLDLLKSVITLAYADDALVPVSLKLAGALIDVVNFLLGLFNRVSGSCGFLLL